MIEICLSCLFLIYSNQKKIRNSNKNFFFCEILVLISHWKFFKTLRCVSLLMEIHLRNIFIYINHVCQTNNFDEVYVSAKFQRRLIVQIKFFWKLSQFELYNEWTQTFLRCGQATSTIRHSFICTLLIHCFPIKHVWMWPSFEAKTISALTLID